MTTQSSGHIAAYSNLFNRAEVRASCSCGWIGVDRESSQDALSDFEAHVALAGPCATCKADVERARKLMKDAGFSDEKAATESATVTCWEHARG